MPKQDPQIAHVWDKSRRYAWIILIISLVCVLSVLYFGRQSLDISMAELGRLTEVAKHNGWGIPALIGMFVFGAFLGVPQWLLIGGSVLTFGPYQGALIAWIATMISAIIDFWLGKIIGAERLQLLAGERVSKLRDLIKERGLLASFIVRLVPSGPFVIVNMIAGLINMRLIDFMIGTGVGIIPKILIVAFAGLALFEVSEDGVAASVFIALGLMAMMILGLMWLRKYFKSKL